METKIDVIFSYGSKCLAGKYNLRATKCKIQEEKVLVESASYKLES